MGREAQKRTKPQGLGEFLSNEFRQAVQDIRQKVVEQGWFGRVTTPKPVVEMPFQTVEADLPKRDLNCERRPSFEEMWAVREPAVTPDRASLDIEHDV